MMTGVDLGGSKMEAAVLTDDGEMILRRRVPTPRGDYEGTVSAMASLVASVESDAGGGSDVVGIGTPGSESPHTGLMRNCNSTVLNGKALRKDLQNALGREVILANDANCLAMSEAEDGAAAGHRSCVAIILGTGVGGGVVIDGQIISGANGIAGEWGHMPLPWPRADECPGPRCWCGQDGCLEGWLSGPALESAWEASHGAPCKATDIARAHPDSIEMQQWLERLARASALLINLIDPEIIVVGGGLNAIEAIYSEVPPQWPQWVFCDEIRTRLVPAMHGDSSGVRGAARLSRTAIRPEH